jgi:hypothetical protein
MHNCGIHEDGVIEDAHSFSEASISEILTPDSDLSIATDRATSRSNIEDFRSLIVIILDTLS